jgi:hypothetical protein
VQKLVLNNLRHRHSLGGSLEFEPPPVMKIVFPVSFMSILLGVEISPGSHIGLRVSDAKDSDREPCALFQTSSSLRCPAGLES